tara:strand:- start:43 stop:816 length:774 start_codon:yes stop_codon:yes gene_type:complete
MEEVIKCDECGETFENKKIKANHVRWKHKDQSAYLKNVGSTISKSYDNKYGKILKETVECSHVPCNNNIDIEYRAGEKNKKKDKYFCSRSCGNSRGKRSDETKQKISNALKRDPRVFTACCKNCSKEFKHTRTKMYCSSECIKEFKRRNRTELQNYRADASFNFNVFDYPEEFNLDLINKHGFYSAANRGNNLNGISRDHMYSCKMGLINNIDPKLLGHPANCKLMRHNDNVSKYAGSSITIEELLERIAVWDKTYL